MKTKTLTNLALTHLEGLIENCRYIYYKRHKTFLSNDLLTFWI